MTVDEMVRTVFENVGEPTDLLPYDPATWAPPVLPTQPGTVRIIELLNRAYRRVTNWKMPNGHVIRFSTCNRRKPFTVDSVDTTVADASDREITLGSPVMGITGKYVEWTMEIGSERRLIVSYDGATQVATVHSAFSTTPAPGSDVTLYKRFFRFEVPDPTFHPGEIIPLSIVGEVQSVQSVYDVTNNSQITRAKRTDETWQNMLEPRSTVGQFSTVANGIEFDMAPEDGTSFLMRYYGLPEPLETLDQAPRIPEAWHDLIVMMATWYRLKTDGETDEAYALRKDAEAFVAQMVQEAEMSFEFEEASLYIGEE